jgi:hypothetical protein
LKNSYTGPIAVGVILWNAASTLVSAVRDDVAEVLKRLANELIHRIHGDVMMPFRPLNLSFGIMTANTVAFLAGSILLLGIGWWFGSWLYSEGAARHPLTLAAGTLPTRRPDLR